MTAAERAIGRVDRTRSALAIAVRRSASVDLSFLPHPLQTDGWAAAPDLLRLLYSLVAALQPRHIVEFGSGISTVVFAQAAAELDGCVITSVDHDPRFAEMTAGSLGEQHALVSLQCAPLVARVQAGRLGPGYLVDDSRLASPRPADLVFVDGPPEVLGGRAAMLPQALEYAQCGTVVLFDDADRGAEQAALAAWESRLGDAVEVHRPEGFSRGLAAFILAAPRTAEIRLTQWNL